MSQYTPHTAAETEAMLASLGLSSLDGLFSDIPATVPRGLPGENRPGLTQMETLRAMEDAGRAQYALPAHAARRGLLRPLHSPHRAADRE